MGQMRHSDPCGGEVDNPTHLHMSLKALLFPTEIPAFCPFSTVFHTHISAAYLREGSLPKLQEAGPAL